MERDSERNIYFCLDFQLQLTILMTHITDQTVRWLPGERQRKECKRKDRQKDRRKDWFSF